MKQAAWTVFFSTLAILPLQPAQARKHKVSTPTVSSFDIHDQKSQNTSTTVIGWAPGTKNVPWERDSNGQIHLGIVSPPEKNFVDLYPFAGLGFYKRVEVQAHMNGATTQMQFKWIQQIQGTENSNLSDKARNIPDWIPDGDKFVGLATTQVSSASKTLYLWDSPGAGRLAEGPNDYWFSDLRFRDAVVWDSPRGQKDVFRANGTRWSPGWVRVMNLRAAPSGGDYAWYVDGDNY